VVQLPVTAAVKPGSDVTLVNGEPQQTERTKDAASTKLEISGADFSVVLGGTSTGGTPLPLSPSGAPILSADVKLATSGDGYFPGTQIEVYVLEPLTSLGSIQVNADGAFAGSIAVPPGLPAGEYVIQMNGYTPAAQVRSISVGVTVRSAVLGACRAGWPAASAACGKVVQRVKSRPLLLPRRIIGGRNLLLRHRVRLDSGLIAKVTVLCRPIARAAPHGEVAYCTSHRKGRRTYLLVRQGMPMTARVILTAPATGKYAAYRYVRSYRIG
jgi:hypothetical protein